MGSLPVCVLTSPFRTMKSETEEELSYRWKCCHQYVQDMRSRKFSDHLIDELIHAFKVFKSKEKQLCRCYFRSVATFDWWTTVLSESENHQFKLDARIHKTTKLHTVGQSDGERHEYRKRQRDLQYEKEKGFSGVFLLSCASSLTCVFCIVGKGAPLDRPELFGDLPPWVFERLTKYAAKQVLESWLQAQNYTVKVISVC